MNEQYPTGSYSTGSYSTSSFRALGNRAPRKNTSWARSYLFFVVALLIAGGTGLWVWQTLQKASSGQQAVPTVKVSVAARDIALGTSLTEEDIKVVDWPEESAPSARVGEKGPLVGRVAKIDLFSGEPILDPRLAPIEAGKGLNALIPSGLRAQAVRVTDESGVAGFVHPGDFVDVVMVFNLSVPFSTVASRTVLQNIKVIATGDEYQT